MERPFRVEVPTLRKTPPTLRAHLGVVNHGFNDFERLKLRETGIKHVRVPLYFHLWLRDEAYRAGWAASYNAAVAEGLRPLGVLNGQGVDLEEAIAFGVERAKQFPGAFWQLWNEVDGWHPVYGGFTDLFGADRVGLYEVALNYGRWFNEAQRAMRAADPHCTLVTSGICGDTPVDPWFEGLREVGARPDATAVHVYGSAGQEFRERYRDRARRLYPSTPAWVTEFGPAGFQAGDDAAQLEVWQEAARSIRYYDRVYGYAFYNDGLGFHIFQQDWTPRLAALWLAEAMKV